MPVVDHPVHEHGIRGSDHRYGCHNRPEKLKPLVVIKTRIDDIGLLYAVERKYPHRMSHECRYDRSLADPHCAGCRHAGSGERYVTENCSKGAK